MEDSIEWELSIVFLVAVDSEAGKVRDLLCNLSKATSEGAIKEDGNCTIYYIKIDNILLKVIYSKCPPPYQGGDPAAWQTTLLINKYNPYCLIMLGMCAGNEQEGLDIGDVVISSTVYRHDYGKIISRPSIFGKISGIFRPFHRPYFEARGASAKISVDDKLIQKINTNLLYNDINSSEDFKIKMGVISSGCQVVKLTHAHKIISEKLGIKQAAGEGHNRVMLGIDMESYSIAYASNRHQCKWIVIKGVSDLGQPESSIDDGAHAAVTNSFTTAISVIEEAIVPLFLEEAGESAISNAENTALDAYKNGDIEKEITFAKEAFQKGIRTVKIRRRLLHGLVEIDRFDKAEQICNYLKSTNLLYDGNTAEYIVQILSRKGEYQKALEIVEEFMENNKETIHMIYISASSSYHLAERDPQINSDPALLINNDRFNKSIELIKNSISRMEDEEKQMPWLYIFGYFLYAIKTNYTKDDKDIMVLTEMREKADKMLSEMTSNHQGLAAMWFHRLLFFAISNNRNNFDKNISIGYGKRVSWTRLDSAYLRLKSLSKHSVLNEEEFRYYWQGLCEWVAKRAPRYGEPAQSITKNSMHTNKP